MSGIAELINNKYIPKDISKRDVFYYDETNNVRKFVLREDEFNNDISNAYFVLGGLIIRKEQAVDLEPLLSSMKLQKTIQEIKFKNLAGKSKTYSELLSNKRIQVFLKWIDESNILVHFMCLNFVFYSLADIVDSLGFNDAHMQTLSIFHMQLKTALYNEVVKDLDSYLALLFKYGYPNIDRIMSKEFMNEFYDIYYLNYCPSDDIEDFYTELLKQMLKAARHSSELVFLHDNESLVLIDDFSMNYITSMVRFPNSRHIFDHEVVVEKYINRFDNKLAETINYDFVDSFSCKLTQLSDAFVGLVSRFLSFIEWSTKEDIVQFAIELSDDQLSAQIKLMEIISKSEAYSKITTQFIGALTSLEKWHFFNRLVRDRKKSFSNSR